MFTGLIQSLGQVVSLTQNKNSGYLRIKVFQSLPKLNIGDSLAVDGCCLTVIKKTKSKKPILDFDLSSETIKKTIIHHYKKDRLVNLEPALKYSDRLGGHLVSGHIDGVGQIKKINRESNSSLKIDISFSKKFAPLLIDKGSIAVDGISLTVCDLKLNKFSVYVIPETEKKTSLSERKINDFINLEFDLLGKYVQRLISLQ